MVAVALGLTWCVRSAADGGLRAAFTQLTRPWPRCSGAPDAREQVRGPFVRAIAALQRQPIDRTTTVAVVVRPRDRPTFWRSPDRIYETTYRLYPTKPAFFARDDDGSLAPIWADHPPGRTPVAPGIWEHDLVVWADPETLPEADGYEMLYANPAARVFRRARGSG